MRHDSLRATRAIVTVLLPVFLLGLVGCAGRTAPSPTATTVPPAPSATPTQAVPEPTVTASPAPTATPEPVPEPVASFEQAPCPFSVPSGVAVDCGYVVVPEDHNRPGGPTIKLSFALFRDDSEHHQTDPLVLLAGGPGEKAFERAFDLALYIARFAPNRDLVIFDQRGVGASKPALECPEVVDVAFDLLDETDPEVALKAQFDAILACRDRLVAEGHDLSVYTTAQSAADLDALREALGYGAINLYGGSYGSFLAQAVMRDHPEGIRSVILESVWPLEVSFLVESAEKTMRTSLQLLDECAAEESCAIAYPDLTQVLFDVIDELNTDPAPITVTNPLDGQAYPAFLTGDAVYGILVSAFYQTRLLPALPQAIHDVGEADYALMTQLSGARLMLFDLVTRGMQYSVICTEDLIGRTPEELLERAEALPRQLRGRADPEMAIEYGIFGICDSWPVVEADASFKEPLVSDIPTLIIAGQFDGITPPEYARQVAEGLSSGFLIEVPGAGHDGETQSDCAATIISAFIDEPTAAPDDACIDDLPGLEFDLPSEPVEVTLEPWTSESVGLAGVAPAGWEEVQPGIFARASSALDPVAMQVVSVPGSTADLLAIVTPQFGLDQAPESAGRRAANGLDWTLYAFDVNGVFRYLGLAENEGRTLVVVLRYDPDEGDAIYSEVFLPVVDALVPNP